jgi:hypothetical protein
MKEGDTVFVLTRTQKIKEGILGDESTAQGFYTRWSSGHHVRVKFHSDGHDATTVRTFNDENIFSTKVDAKRELFKRRLRYAVVRDTAA